MHHFDSVVIWHLKASESLPHYYTINHRETLLIVYFFSKCIFIKRATNYREDAGELRAYVCFRYDLQRTNTCLHLRTCFVIFALKTTFCLIQKPLQIWMFSFWINPKCKRRFKMHCVKDIHGRTKQSATCVFFHAQCIYIECYINKPSTFVTN